jgi:ParB family chromosome partitioning protein
MPNTSVTVEQIPVEKVTPSQFQARKSFDDGPLKELADSMKTEGLIQPIIVRLSAAGTYELIAGERRLRAAKLLGWTAIDAIVRPEVSDKDAALKGIIENLQRVDLNPLERAIGYKRLVDMGLSQEEIGGKMGIGQTTVARYLALLDLPEPIQELMPHGILSEGHTRPIRQIPDKAQQIKVAQQADKEGWSVKETEKRVNQLLGKGPKADGSSAPHAPSSRDFVWKGEEIAINRHFKPASESVQDYVAWLSQALQAFRDSRPASKNGHSEVAAVTANPAVVEDGQPLPTQDVEAPH